MKARIIIIALISWALQIYAQNNSMDDYSPFGDFSPFKNQDKGYEYVDCNDKEMNVWEAKYCTGRYGLGAAFHKSAIPNTSELYSKVARGVAAQRPISKSSSSTKGKVGSYNYQTSDAHRQWLANKQERDAQARREAAERKRLEDLQKKIADDNRAAAVEAETNARLQSETNRRIARDQWHATQGAQLVQQRAREAHKLTGPQFANNKPAMTAQQKAATLRNGNRVRKSGSTKRNVARVVLPPVKRIGFTGAAPRSQLEHALAELKKRQQKLAAQSSGQEPAQPVMGKDVTVGGTRFVLSDHATSSLGQDWETVTFTTPRIPSKEKPKMSEADYHRLYCIEMIEGRTLTPQEKAYFDQFSIN